MSDSDDIMQDCAISYEDLSPDSKEIKELMNTLENKHHEQEQVVKELKDELAILNKTITQHQTLKDNYERKMREVEMALRCLGEISRDYIAAFKEKANKSKQLKELNESKESKELNESKESRGLKELNKLKELNDLIKSNDLKKSNESKESK